MALSLPQLSPIAACDTISIATHINHYVALGVTCDTTSCASIATPGGNSTAVPIAIHQTIGMAKGAPIGTADVAVDIASGVTLRASIAALRITTGATTDTSVLALGPSPHVRKLSTLIELL